MDWDVMLSDLESSFDAERRADLVAQSAELAEAEHASIEAVDRLWARWGARFICGRAEACPSTVSSPGSSPLTSLWTRGRDCRRSSRWPRWRRWWGWPVRRPGMRAAVLRWGRCCVRSLDAERGCAWLWALEKWWDG